MRTDPEKLRIVSWDLHGAAVPGKASHRQQRLAWQHLVDLDADIILLQEVEWAAIPASSADVWSQLKGDELSSPSDPRTVEGSESSELLARAQAALEAYDYDLACELLKEAPRPAERAWPSLARARLGSGVKSSTCDPTGPLARPPPGLRLSCRARRPGRAARLPLVTFSASP